MYIRLNIANCWKILLINSLPKSKNMDLKTISSQNLTKEMAYLLGVYLTDGSILKNRNIFSLKTIDKDFAEYTLSCIKKIIPSCVANVFTYQPKDREWNNGKISKCQLQYCIACSFKEYKEFFETQTNFENHIPLYIWDASLDIKKWFIAGIMDGDGWISKTNRKEYNCKYQYRIGIGELSNGWIYEFKKLLQQLGVVTLKEEIVTKDSNGFRKPFVRFGIRPTTFVEHGLFFTTKRKQDRLLEYIKSLKTFRD